MVAVVLFFSAILFLPLTMTLQMEAMDSPAVRQAAREFLSLHDRIWLPTALLVVLLVLHNVIFSHRIAGPLYRIRNDLKRIGDGNLFVQVKLRKNDYLDKEAESINGMIEALRAKIRNIDLNQRKASAVLGELQTALARGAAEEMTDQIDDLAKILGRLKESVEQFQLPREVIRVPDATQEPVTSKPPREPVGAGNPQRG